MKFNKCLNPLLASLTLIVAGCGGGGSSRNAPPAPPPVEPEPQMLTFDVSLTNLTLAQPLSPPAIVLHRSAYSPFTDGESASLPLEVLAEGGDRTDFITEVTDSGELLAAYEDTNPIAPLSIGATEQLSILADDADDVRLTTITMLVHNNDAFTGINAANIAGMAVGETRIFNGPTWDAGTENAASMPGPDFGGEGFNPARDDIVERIRFHQGVVTAASIESGDPDSALLERHRFDNPSSRLSITRIE